MCYTLSHPTAIIVKELETLLNHSTKLTSAMNLTLTQFAKEIHVKHVSIQFIYSIMSRWAPHTNSHRMLFTGFTDPHTFLVLIMKSLKAVLQRSPALRATDYTLTMYSKGVQNNRPPTLKHAARHDLCSLRATYAFGFQPENKVVSFMWALISAAV